MSDELRQFFLKQREREETIRNAVTDLKEVEAFNEDLGKTNVPLIEAITRYELEDQKLDTALKKRGF